MKPTAFTEPVYVTKPFLPSLEEFKTGLEEIWKNQWLTNDGPVIRRFEKELSKFLKTENLSVFNNGTLALQLGLQGLGVSGEVITTPFTFVATTHALYWDKIRPVFCDIGIDDYNIDPDEVEKLITPWTTAILAVHTFGTPCKLTRLQEIAERHNLFLIYDSAHAFGVEVDGMPISQFGDMNMFSFHATKTYHSIEGGLLTFKDAALKKKLNYLKNFGFENEVEVVMPGTNAKMSEVHALMGLQNMQYFEIVVQKRAEIVAAYRERLASIDGIIFLKNRSEVKTNHSYMPVRIMKEQFGVSRDQLYERLKVFNVFSRRYFYPLIPDFPCYRQVQLPHSIDIARKVADEILTLPIYYDLSIEDVHRICDIIVYIKNEA